MNVAQLINEVVDKTGYARKGTACDIIERMSQAEFNDLCLEMRVNMLKAGLSMHDDSSEVLTKSQTCTACEMEYDGDKCPDCTVLERGIELLGEVRDNDEAEGILLHHISRGGDFHPTNKDHQ